MADSLEDIDISSEEVQEILSDVPHWPIRWGSTIIFLLVLMVFLLSWLIKYPDILNAKVVITTLVPPEKEFAMVSAKIDTILVEDSQLIGANTILGVLDNSANTEDVFYLKSIVDTISIEKGLSNFPVDSLGVLILGNIGNTLAEFKNNYFEFELNQKLQPYDNIALANKISLSELQRRLRNLLLQENLIESEFEFEEKELGRNKVLFDRGVISSQEFEDKQLGLISAKRNLKSMELSISQIHEEISESRKELKGNKIVNTREEMLLSNKVVQSFSRLKKSLRDWEDDYVLKSTIAGTVAFSKFWNKNQTVQQGDLIFTIIPNISSDYVAKISAPPRNSGKIEIGQDVNIRLENYPETEFGVLKGRIAKISITPDESGFYVIDVVLPKSLVTTYNNEIRFKQGMTGNADIITDDLRLLERFFYQFREATTR